MIRNAMLVFVLVLAVPGLSAAQNATSPGVVTAEHPTLTNLSIDWAISGDANFNGRVSVRFRPVGTGVWREGHPLFRVPAGSNAGFSWSNRHSGSLFGLTPDTAYEIELSLFDPDGGNATRSLSATTRPIPEISGSATLVDVTPSTIAAALGKASPGTVLRLSAGSYGGINITRNGLPGAPLVLRGNSLDQVIINGDIRMDGRDHVWLSDLTVRGQIKFNDSAGIVIQGCKIEASRDGIVALGNGTSDGYFADNFITGPTIWRESSVGADGDNLGEGIVVTGPGNVIAHNRVERFRDCISLLEDNAQNQRSIDIIGNDLSECADDAIEADFSMGNVRVISNQSANAFIAWSSQPSLGGPTYFIRNVAFATAFQAFKPHRSSVGDVAYHNTVVKQGDALGVFTNDTWSRASLHNNLFIGGPEAGSVNGYANGQGRILFVPSLNTGDSSLDYNGYGSALGRFDGRFGTVSFSDFAGLTATTSEMHSTSLDVGVFISSFAFPTTMFPARGVPDLRLNQGSAAVDRGIVLRNVNDGFCGGSPDLGAYEAGTSSGSYGPRADRSVFPKVGDSNCAAPVSVGISSPLLGVLLTGMGAGALAFRRTG